MGWEWQRPRQHGRNLPGDPPPRSISGGRTQPAMPMPCAHRAFLFQLGHTRYCCVCQRSVASILLFGPGLQVQSSLACENNDSK